MWGEGRKQGPLLVRGKITGEIDFLEIEEIDTIFIFPDDVEASHWSET